MKKLAVLLFASILCLPVFAQDPPAEESAPVEEAPADEAAASEPASDDAAAAADESAEEAAAPVEEAPADSSSETASESGSEDSSSSEEASAEEGDGSGWYLYGGFDVADLEASFSDSKLATKFGCTDCGASFNRVRVGTRVFEVVGLEAHFGMSDSDGTEPNEVEVSQYYGFYAVPTGTFFDLFEIAVPIGYTMMSLDRGAASEDFNRISFGLNLEIPFIAITSWMPEIRVGGGGMVYQSENHARVFGFHFGMRLDFVL